MPARYVQRRRPSPGIMRNTALDNLQQGSHGRSGEVISYSLYDTYLLVSTSAGYSFFKVPLGQGTPAKTMADTNNMLAGVMPQGQRLTVESIKFIIDTPAAMTDALQKNLFDMLFNTTLEIYLPGKDNLGIWTLAELTGLHLLMPLAATYNGPTTTFFCNFRLSVPVILAAQCTFEGRMVHHVAPSAYIDNTKLKMSWAGTLERLS